MAPACQICQWRVQKRINGLCPPFCLGKSCPPALALMPDTSVSPCMPLVPFKLLPWCWSSEGVSLITHSMCGFFKNCLGLQKFLLSTQSLLGVVDRSYGDLSSWHWNPGLGGLVLGLVLGLGLLNPEISLLNFYPSHVGVGFAHSVSAPLLPA